MSIRDKVREESTEVQEQKASTREKVKKQTAKKQKKGHFRRTRMWINYLLSAMQKDRGKIPDNIGDRILITNNVYVTRYYITSKIHVTALSLQTPITLVGEITAKLRKEGSSAIVDATFKNTDFDVKLKDSGLMSRIGMWENTARLTNISNREKEVAARCLYTVEVAKSGVKLYKTRLILNVRAKSGSELTAAESIIYKFLDDIEAEYTQVNGNMKDIMQYESIISDHRDKTTKDLKAIITSGQTLSQMMPNSGSWNGDKGTFLGNNLLNNSQFNLDWKDITIGRNCYIYSPTGAGKTVLAINLCCSAVEEGMAACIQDIKGNEFNNFVNATGGYIVSLRQNSSGYINSWKMNKEDTNDENAVMYFKQRLAFSKEQMIILSGVRDIEQRTDLDELLDAFHDGLYTSLGVLESNRNSWKHTQHLNPFVVYKALLDYMTPSVQKKYESVARKVINSLRMTMSETGSKSYIFKEEFDYMDIMKAPTIMFDFGLLEDMSGLKDPDIFRLKFAYMKKLNGEYAAYKYAKGIKVLTILEESQVAVNDPEIMQGYVDSFTLRRAQGHTTVLLGNSVTALLDNPLSKPLIENIKALFIGKVPQDAKEVVIQRFGLEEYRDIIDEINRNDAYANSFLFVNWMQERALTPVLKVILEKGEKYKLFTPVPQNNSFTV